MSCSKLLLLYLVFLLVVGCEDDNEVEPSQTTDTTNVSVVGTNTNNIDTSNTNTEVDDHHPSLDLPELKFSENGRVDYCARNIATNIKSNIGLVEVPFIISENAQGELTVSRENDEPIDVFEGGK